MMYLPRALCGGGLQSGYVDTFLLRVLDQETLDLHFITTAGIGMVGSRVHQSKFMLTKRLSLPALQFVLGGVIGIPGSYRLGGVGQDPVFAGTLVQAADNIHQGARGNCLRSRLSLHANS